MLTDNCLLTIAYLTQVGPFVVVSRRGVYRADEPKPAPTELASATPATSAASYTNTTKIIASNKITSSKITSRISAKLEMGGGDGTGGGTGGGMGVATGTGGLELVGMELGAVAENRGGFGGERSDENGGGDTGGGFGGEGRGGRIRGDLGRSRR